MPLDETDADLWAIARKTARCMGYGDPVALAHDIFQELCIHRWLSRHKWNAELGEYRHWVCKVARCKAIDVVRRERKRRGQHQVCIDEVAELEDPYDGTADVDSLLDLIQLTQELPTPERLVIAMTYLQLDDRQIASELERTETNVRVLRCRARDKLKDRNT